MSKNNYKIKPLINTGISITEKETEYIGLGGKKHPLLSAFLNILVSALLVFGSVFTLSGMFNFNVNYIVLSAVLAVSVFSFSGIFYLPKKYKRIGILGILALLVIVCAIFYNSLINGFYNAFLFGKDAVFDAMYWTKNYTVDFAALNGADTTFAISVVGVILSLGVTFFNKDRVRFFLIMLITFPFFEIGACFGCVPPYYAFALLLAGWTASFSVFASSIVKRKKGEKKKPNKQAKAAGIGAVVAIITLLAFLGTNFVLSMGGYTRDNGTKDLRLAIKEGFSNIYDLITGEDHDASMKDGKLYKLGDRTVKNRTHLKVTTSGYSKNEDLYIKGFVGAKYTGNSFTEFDNYNKYQEMFNSFEKYELYPQQMMGAALNSLVEEGEDGYIFSLQKNITISNLRRSKSYAYTFENTYFPSEFKYHYDLTAKPTNSSNYSYTCFMDSTSYIKITRSPLYFTDKYQYLRGQYNKYVEEEYLQLPQNNAYLKQMVDKITADAYDDYAIADKIRYYLKDNTKYTDYAGELPDGRDFVNYFLLENKKGYSAHYAATATLMLRAAGVPARYVEGFILTYKDNLKDLKPNEAGNYEIDVTDKEAHAWVEIYSNNYGWISVEVTPGFYSGHLGEENGSGGSSSDEYYVDENSDLIVYIPPAEEPENEVVEQEESSWDSFLKVLKVVLEYLGKILLAALIILLLLLIVLSIKMLIIKTIRKSKTNKQNKEAIFEIYKYFNRLLAFEKIKNKEMLPYLRYAVFASEQSRALTKETALFAMNIFLKAAFSKTGVTQEEIIAANLCVNDYKSKLFKKLNLKEKFVFIFINSLI